MTWSTQDEISYAEAACPETEFDFYDIRQLKGNRQENNDNINNKKGKEISDIELLKKDS
jgi:hypothetical protein|uniref:Uncharacterized protein n=1 Tax=viral metagenome TaxID=1070528 RepID=A0A6C0BQS0_9ZZZZ